MRIFLTGATGYVGSAVLDALVRVGHDVTALVRDSHKAKRAAARGARPVVGDLADPESFRVAADAQDGYIHTALDSTPNRGRAIEDAALDIIIAAARRPRTAGSPAASRFIIYTSGLWVLGPTTEPASEESPVNPLPFMSWRLEHERKVLNAASDHLRTCLLYTSDAADE